MTEAPRRISNRVLHADPSGFFSPFEANDQPVLIGSPGTDNLFVAVFETERLLRAFMREAKIDFHKIKLVTDGPEFVASLTDQLLRVMQNPYFLPNGRIRFTEVVTESQDLPEYKP